MKTGMTAIQYFNGIKLGLLAQAVERLAAENDSRHRRGGVLAIAIFSPHNAASPRTESSEANQPFDFHSRAIGSPGPKVAQFARSAAEKIARLIERVQDPSITIPEVASSESADPDNANPKLRTYGGCIVFLDKYGRLVLISYSGAPPEVDEAIAFAIGKRLGLKAPGYHNPLVPRAFNLLQEVV